MESSELHYDKPLSEQYFYRLFRALVVIAVLGTLALACLTVFLLRPTLRGDEALYWDMSRHLALGYASKPPAIAYLLRAFTTVFGNDEWALRLPAITLMVLFLFCSYNTAKELFGNTLAGWITVYILLFDFQYLGNLRNITTNNLLYLFWILALLCYWRAFRGRSSYWVGLGIALGLGFLSKYSIAFLVVSLLLHISLTKPVLWLKPGIWKAIIIALLINTGVIYWNLSYSLLSFTHTMRILENSQPTAWYTFILGQVLAVGPVAFVAYIFILFLMLRKVRTFPGKNVLLYSAAIPIVFYYMLSLTRSLYRHWVYPGWLGVMIGCGYYSVLVIHFWPRHKTLIIRSFLVLFSIHLVLMVLFAVLILTGNVPADNHPFKHEWPKIWRDYLQDRPAVSPFVFSTNYSSSARLAYYTPGQPRTYCIEMLMQQEPNQYDVWGGWEDLVGCDGWLVEVQEPEVVLGFAVELVEGGVFSSYKFIHAVAGKESQSIVQADRLPITVVLMQNYLGKPPAQFIEERSYSRNEEGQTEKNIQRLISVVQEVADHMPQYGYAQKRCADILLFAGNKQGALPYFERALSLEKASDAQLALMEKVARVYFDLGNREKASELYTAIKEKQPDNVIANEGLADIAFEQGNYEKAEKYFLRLGEIDVEKAEKAAEFLMRIGIHWSEQKRYEDAARALMAAANYSSRHAVALLFLGDIEKEKEQYSSAYLCYMKFMWTEPESYEGAARINTLVDMLGKESRAADMWAKVACQVPESVLPHIQLGLALEQENRFAEAAAAFKTASENSETVDRAQVYAATSLVLEGGVDEGIQQLRHTLDTAPEVYPVVAERLVTIAPIFAASKRYEDLFQLCAVLVAYTDNQPEVLTLITMFSGKETYDYAVNLYCLLLEKPGLATKAAKALDELLGQYTSAGYRRQKWEERYREHPNVSVIPYYLAAALFDMGDYENSKTLLRTLADSGPLEIDGQLRLAILESLAAVENIENESAFIPFVQQHPEIEPAACSLVEAVCTTLQEQDRVSEATRLAQQLLVVAPEREASWLLIGDIYKKEGDTDKALAYYRTGIQESNTIFRIARAINALLELSGQPEKRLDTWQSIACVLPENQVVQRYLADALAATENLEQAAALYRELLTKAAATDEDRVRYGCLLLQLGREESGYEQISQAVMQTPTLNVMAATACRQAGDYLMLRTQYSAAKNAYKTGLQYSPESAMLKLKMLEVLCKSEEMSAAADMVETILKETNSDATIEAAIRLWDAYREEQEPPYDSVQRWKRLHESKPDSFAVLEQYIVSLAQAGGYKHAKEVCESSLAASTECLVCAAIDSYMGTIRDANDLYDLAVSQKGIVSEKIIAVITDIAFKLKAAQKYAQCERVLLALEVLQPGNLWHQVYLGALYAEQGCYEEALKRFRDILFVAPDSLYTADLMDFVYKSMNLPEKHVAEWQALVELNPGAFIPLEHLRRAQLLYAGIQ